MAVLDGDRNGTLSAAELADAPKALATLDKNTDGQLTREELSPGPAGDRGPRGPEGRPGPGAGGPPPRGE
jgi:hypothetical protein